LWCGLRRLLEGVQDVDGIPEDDAILAGAIFQAQLV
jgi:hypothetical protein